MPEQTELPNIELDINDKTSLLYRLLLRLISKGFGAYENKNESTGQTEVTGEIDIDDTMINPIIFVGPSDPFDEDNASDISKWKTGPIYLKWDDDQKVWIGGVGIHHHLSNTTQQGGIAFAYFFR